MILGAHVSAAGGVSKAPQRAADWNITAFQIFTRNQNRWQSKPLPVAEIEAFHDRCLRHGIKAAFAHNSYLINLCAADEAIRVRSRIAMADEILRADALGLTGLVMHPGSHLGAGVEAGIRTIADELRSLLDGCPHGKTRILLEHTAGQGTNIGWRFEQLAEILDLSGYPDRMGVCLDTCHLFAAGYDWTTPEGYGSVWAEFQKIIGFDRLHCVHITDSKRELGSRVDRHEQIGAGLIGREPFALLLRDYRLADIPAILETPGDDEDYIRNLNILRAITR